MRVRVRVRVRAAVAGHVGVIAEKDQRSLFQLRLRADYELALNLELVDIYFEYLLWFYFDLIFTLIFSLLNVLLKNKWTDGCYQGILAVYWIVA